jgi:hypothetical protein
MLLWLRIMRIKIKSKGNRFIRIIKKIPLVNLVEESKKLAAGF